MVVFTRKACYHETDKMGIVHHSNYIKWMEEARIFVMDAAGYRYKSFEDNGVFSPVLSLKCEYKKSVFFDDVVNIDVVLKESRAAILTFRYSFSNTSKNCEICAIAESSHCLIDSTKKVVNIRKRFPEFVEKLESICKG